MAVGWKLLALTVLLLSISYLGKTLPGAITGVFLLIGLWKLSSFTLGKLAKQLWQMKFLLIVVLVPQLIFSGILQGVYNTVAVMVGLLLAVLVSLTTKTIEIVELLKRITKSQNFALLIALSINSIALVTNFAKNIADASRARGVKPKLIRQIVSLFVVSLRFADDYAEALAARGISV